METLRKVGNNGAMTTAQLARATRIPQRTILYQLATGHIRGYRIGPHARWSIPITEAKRLRALMKS